MLMKSPKCIIGRLFFFCFFFEAGQLCLDLNALGCQLVSLDRPSSVLVKGGGNGESWGGGVVVCVCVCGGGG